MTPTPEQKNEQLETVDPVKKNSEKLNAVKDVTLGESMKKKNLKEPESKDIKDPRENVFDKDGKYKPQYLEFVNIIADRPKVLQDVITIGKEK